MDPLSVANGVLGLVSVAWKAANNAGIVGSPDWVKYVNAGLFVTQGVLQIIDDLKSGRAAYDTMTPDEIKRRLTPDYLTWDDIEAQAAKEMAPST